MGLEQLVDFFGKIPLPIGIMVYFIWRDIKYQDKFSEVVVKFEATINEFNELINKLKKEK